MHLTLHPKPLHLKVFLFICLSASDRNHANRPIKGRGRMGALSKCEVEIIFY